jgi:hypothetical protein
LGERRLGFVGAAAELAEPLPDAQGRFLHQVRGAFTGAAGLAVGTRQLFQVGAQCGEQFVQGLPVASLGAAQ